MRGSKFIENLNIQVISDYGKIVSRQIALAPCEKGISLDRVITY